MEAIHLKTIYLKQLYNIMASFTWSYLSSFTFFILDYCHFKQFQLFREEQTRSGVGHICLELAVISEDMSV